MTQSDHTGKMAQYCVKVKDSDRSCQEREGRWKERDAKLEVWIHCPNTNSPKRKLDKKKTYDLMKVFPY